MPLTKFVKVGNISNLSDARYCAGMGVDLLGFRVIEGQPGFIGSKQFQEIRGWISGPKIVAEVYGIEKQDQLTTIAEEYRPDFIELGLKELTFITEQAIPIILSISTSELKVFKSAASSKVSYILVTDFNNNIDPPKDIPVLIDLTSIGLQAIHDRYAECGIALNGSSEISPGLKSYEQLADVLERLESD